MPNRRLWVTLIFILAPGVLLAPVWLSGGLGAAEDDVLYYFPSRLYFHQTINDGHWPWLNPLTGVGRPFAADPQSAVWYPPTWLFALMHPQGAALPICRKRPISPSSRCRPRRFAKP